MIITYPFQWPTGWPRTERRQWSNFKVRAIDLTIAAVRGLDRWGTKELVNAAFSGFKALPPGGDAAFVSGQPTCHSKEDRWEVLGVGEKRAQRGCLRCLPSVSAKAPPRHGGEQAEFERIKSAYDAGMEAR